MLTEKDVNPGLKLALTYIDSKIRHIDDTPYTTKSDLWAEGRLEGARSALVQVRERIVRALGTDAE